MSGLMNSMPTNLNDNIPRGDSCSDLESLGYDTESSAGSTEGQHEKTSEVIEIGSSTRFEDLLKVVYTNPDVLLSKRDEMMTCICEVNPDITAMVEIYPKSVKREIETCELQIDDYTFYVNEAPKRGCIIYVKNCLVSSSHPISSSDYEDIVF